MSSPNAVTQLLHHRTLVLLLLCLGAVIAPHLLRLPAWISVIVIASALWRYLADLKGRRLPPRWLLFPITLATIGGVYYSYGTLLGLDAGVAALAAMLGLKLLELRRRRDSVVVLYLGFFLVVTQLFYSTTLFMAVYMLCVVWAMTTLLITVTRPGNTAIPLEHGRLAGAMVLQAIPIMVLLFVFFPRISGPLWGMPERTPSPVTGLSDSMSPGSIGELSQSDAVAFRVEFETEIPHSRDLYWRGPVLPDYDGRTWRKPNLRRPGMPAIQYMAGQVDYTVTMEPNNKPWIFTLEMPRIVDTPVHVDSEFQIRRDAPVRERLRYQVSSSLNYRLQPRLSADDTSPYLALPDDAHSRTVEMARQWREQAPETQSFIRRALEHFRQEPFIYTLNPPKLPDDPVDEFLFETRRGFCEHFASAFAVMMRAGGVPSRVVMGYQGGEINPTGGYLIVRQSDAHAWVELFIAGEGWRRFDPTAWVAPERVEGGIASALPETDSLPTMARRDPGWMRSMSLQWDALNAYWDRWVLAYGPDLQQQLMKRLGLTDWQRMVTAMAITVSLVMVLLTGLILWRGRRLPPDPAVAAWEQFCSRLARAGVGRAAHEGPMDFAARAARERPDKAAAILLVSKRYIAARYADVNGRRDGDLKALRRAVAAFRA